MVRLTLLASAWILLLLAVRVEVAQSPRYVWLVWDLVLAIVPWLLAQAVDRIPPARARPARAGLIVLWLAFLPNAPYLVTELVHFRHEATVPYWLDLAMLSSAALFGLWLGATSTAIVVRQMPARWRAASEALVWLSVGYAIYLGRVERFNSWDLATQPMMVLHRWVVHLGSPNVWAFSAAFAVTLMLAASLFRGRGSCSPSA